MANSHDNNKEENGDWPCRYQLSQPGNMGIKIVSRCKNRHSDWEKD